MILIYYYLAHKLINNNIILLVPLAIDALLLLLAIARLALLLALLITLFLALIAVIVIVDARITSTASRFSVVVFPCSFDVLRFRSIILADCPTTYFSAADSFDESIAAIFRALNIDGWSNTPRRRAPCWTALPARRMLSQPA